MGAILTTIIKIIGLFLLASLGSEILVGVITGNPTNSTLSLITTAITTAVNGVIVIIQTIPIVAVNLILAIIGAIFGFAPDYLPVPTL